MSDDFESAVQSLLDGRPLEPARSTPGDPLMHALHAVDAIARRHRTALFGTEYSPDITDSDRWGPLELRREIGSGASGIVYRAWDARLAREVALKLFEPGDEAGARALEEGRLLARLRHPHIVSVFGADIQNGRAGIWMELLEGETLDDILARDGPFGEVDALLVGIDLAAALSAVHAAGLLHRDIKARNVVRERGGRIVLMDLGAGRSADAVPADGDGTGTPMYMAPEVLVGGSASIGTDIYSLGVLLYRLLTDRFPVDAASFEELWWAHSRWTRTPLRAVRPDLDPAISTAIDRACDPDPAVRFSSASEFETALDTALNRRLLEGASVDGLAARNWRRWRRTAAVMSGAALLVGALGIGGWNTSLGRTLRRKAGFAVPPRSPLYLIGGGALVIVRGHSLQVVPHNPAVAPVIAVASHGVRTMPGVPPFTMGGAYSLAGLPIPAPAGAKGGLCCFQDGTTDGEFNYAVRLDSTLLDPIGSRPLAPPAIFRFNSDWSDPQLLFRVSPVGDHYGIAYAAASRSFYVTRVAPGMSVIEQWSRDGRLLSTPVRTAAEGFGGIAVDPLDGTLWTVRLTNAASVARLENYDTSGRFLGYFDVRTPVGAMPASAEFAWTGR